MQWHQLLAGYVYRITESKETTEEIVQDVFMKIWTVRETMSGINNFKHFLLVVSCNQAFDALKENLKEKECKKAWEQEARPPLYAESAGDDPNRLFHHRRSDRQHATALKRSLPAQPSRTPDLPGNR
jgi:RNA polymerase sigma-70 factor (ECF subfamily)